MRLFGLENRVLSNRSSLFALLGECFPAILPSCWEVSSLAGLSGGSYLLESQPVSRTEKTFSTIKLIARAEGQAQSALFVNRRKEARILKQLKHFAYSPDVIGRNSDWLLLEWVAGDHPCQAQFLSSKFQYQLAEIVAKLHCQTLLSYRLPLRNEIAHYGYRIDKKEYLRDGNDYIIISYTPRCQTLSNLHLHIWTFIQGTYFVSKKCRRC